MPQYRVTFFMGRAEFGWSETWWTVASSLETLVPKINAYTFARSAILPFSCEWLGVRVATEGAARAGRLFRPVSTPLYPGGPVVSIPAHGVGTTFDPGGMDQPRVAMNMGVYSLGRRVAMRYLCPLPDEFTGAGSGSLLWASVGSYRSAFVNYSAMLSSQQWQIKARTPAGGALDHQVANWEIQDAPPNNIVAVLKPGESIAVTQGDEVILRGVKMVRRGLSSPNGVWIADTPSSAGTPAVQRIPLRNSGAFAPALFSKLGWLRVKAPVYISVDFVEGESLGIHKRGGPFGQRRGRASIRA